MIKKQIFDNEKYLREQAAEIKNRIDRFDNNLLLQLIQFLRKQFHPEKQDQRKDNNPPSEH